MTISPCQQPSQPPRISARRGRGRLLAIAMLMTLVAAACGGGGFDSANETASDAGASDDFEPARATSIDATAATAPEIAAYEVAEDAMEDADREVGAASEVVGDSAAVAQNSVTTTGSAGGEQTAQLPDLGRDIIFTASLELASTDVSIATREAIRAIEARGGFLFSQETRGGAGGSSVLTFKVLPDQFQAALNDLGSIGNVRSQSISADDVSAVVVDLESRINTAEASVVRLRDLLDGASELQTIATLENQLLQRETTLEQLRGQLRSIRKQVDLATITVFVTELLNRPGLALETMSFAGHDGGFSCFDTTSTRSGEAGDAITVCYRVTNTGDTPLVDLTFDDPALGATVGTMVLVDGEVTQIDPGEAVVLAQEIELTESVRVRTSVTATGLDADGNTIDNDVKATAPTVRFDVTETDDGVPSFGEVLSDSWNALVTIAVVIALIAVAVAPFAAVALVLGVPAYYWIRRARAARPATTERAPRPAPPGPREPGDTTEAAEETTVDA